MITRYDLTEHNQESCSSRFSREAQMRRYKPLKPSLFAAAVRETVASAAAERRVLDVGYEASRISTETGVSPRAAAKELILAGIKARIDLEFPRLSKLDPSPDFLKKRRRERGIPD
jgi:hypothetical protein